MATKKQKLQQKMHRNMSQVSYLIDQNMDLLDIARITEQPLHIIIYYCAKMKKAPGLGDFDLNWYLNGYTLRHRKLEEEKKKIAYNRPFKPTDNWFDNL